MTTQELKQQVREEFDKEFPLIQFDITKHGSVKDFIDFIIDKTVQHEQERISEESYE